MDVMSNPAGSPRRAELTQYDRTDSRSTSLLQKSQILFPIEAFHSAHGLVHVPSVQLPLVHARPLEQGLSHPFEFTAVQDKRSQSPL